jgi:predicted nucleotidyltransferase
MRLTPAQRKTIRDTVRSLAGADARVRLFGSRTDDRARGGDIDLLVEVDRPVHGAALLGARIGARLQQALGDRRIDVVLSATNTPPQPIVRMAREEGIEL